MSDHYSTQQTEAIRQAIRAGRHALMQNGESPRMFAAAYIRAGGLQLPGGTLPSDTRRRVESRIMVAVGGRSSDSRESAAIEALIAREIARILGEVQRFHLMMHPKLHGFRLEIPEHASQRKPCLRFLALDAYGLGPGVVPAHEIVVLPPCCDEVRWIPLYE
ncbi:MAG: hypothetical protein KDI68_10705 [Gammaproteobacteria bacterium]|nr:hypothetical protein [Gammaproteobacteria bacterium]